MAGTLVLGPVVFQGFEVPERLRFGGRQRLVVHSLPGGGRVVDAMGGEEGPVSWSGVMSGGSAGVRVRQLEGMRRGGAAWPLSWEGWLYTVVVESFEAEAANASWMPYRLQACVVSVGDVASVLVDTVTPVLADLVGFGGQVGDAGSIEVAAGQLGSDDPMVAMGAAGVLARLVAGRALSGVLGGS